MGCGKLIVARTESHVIKRGDALWNTVDMNCFYSKNLYNLGNYMIRQEFLNNWRWIRYKELDKLMQETDAYKELKSQPSQCVLQVLDRSWKSFFVTIKDWNKNPDKYLGRPKIPKYLSKSGRYPWYIKNNSCYIKDQVLHFQVKRLHGATFPTRTNGRLLCVRFIPLVS